NAGHEKEETQGDSENEIHARRIVEDRACDRRGGERADGGDGDREAAVEERRGGEQALQAAEVALAAGLRDELQEPVLGAQRRERAQQVLEVDRLGEEAHPRRTEEGCRDLRPDDAERGDRETLEPQQTDRAGELAAPALRRLADLRRHARAASPRLG